MQVVRGRGVITEQHRAARRLIEPEEHALTEASRLIYNFNWIIFFTPPFFFSEHKGGPWAHTAVL